MLLAKSENQVSLKQHIDDCLLVCDEIESQFKSIFTLNNIPNNFFKLLKIAIIFHDLGKAHANFQKLLKGGDKSGWLRQRHELFSLPFLGWVAANKLELDLLILIISSHHKSLDVLVSDYIFNTYTDENCDLDWDDDKLSFDDEFNKVDMVGVLDVVKNYIDVDNSELLSKEYFISLIVDYVKNVSKYDDNLTKILIVGAFKHCDRLGSARITNIKNIDYTSFKFLDEIQMRLTKNNKNFYGHQIKCSETLGNLLLVSPTGSGKTESSLLWVRNQIKNFGGGRIFYVLPYTASINAMYERLSKLFDDDSVGMLHGKISDYLNENFNDNELIDGDKKQKIFEIKKKYNSLLTQIKVVTPFQMLKHLFALNGFEQGIFEMVGSYFIFDEIHAYDAKVFAQIKVLMEFVTKKLNAKVMIMTATMPTFLRQEIKSALTECNEIFADDSLFKDFVRHKLHIIDDNIENRVGNISNDIAVGKKVLIVCNTVKQSQHIFETLSNTNKDKIGILIHSKFNSEDRSKQEKRLMELESSDEKIFLVGTQAIEVSLDIDFDVIYSECASIDAVLQRFGRVNRKRSKGICDCFIFSQSNKSDFFIYNKNIIKRTLETFSEIVKKESGIINEKNLQKHIDYVYPAWELDELKNFSSQYDYLTASLKYLRASIQSKKTEEDFYNQFDSHKIVPYSLMYKFIDRLEDMDFIGAESLKVTISDRQFAAYANNGYIEKKRHIFKSLTNINEIFFYTLHKKYDENIGLLNEDIDIKNTTQFL